MDDPTPEDLGRDLAAALEHCRHPETLLAHSREGWFAELAAAAARRALAAERALVWLVPTGADRRHEPLEVLHLAEEAAQVAGYDPERPSPKRARDQLRRDCLDVWPAHARRLIAAEARVRELESVLAAACGRLDRAAHRAEHPPAGTRVEHDPHGNVTKIIFPEETL